MSSSEEGEVSDVASSDSLNGKMTNLDLITPTITFKSLKHVRTENKDDPTLTTIEDHHGFMT